MTKGACPRYPIVLRDEEKSMQSRMEMVKTHQCSFQLFYRWLPYQILSYHYCTYYLTISIGYQLFLVWLSPSHTIVIINFLVFIVIVTVIAIEVRHAIDYQHDITIMIIIIIIIIIISWILLISYNCTFLHNITAFGSGGGNKNPFSGPEEGWVSQSQSQS